MKLDGRHPPGPLAAAMAVAALLVSSGPAAGEPEAEIRELVAAFNAAYERNDLEAYFACYAPDATVQWWPDGRQPVDRYREQWGELIASGARVIANEISDVQVRLAPGGAAAVATYRVRLEMRSGEGGSSREEALETDVIHHIDGRWLVVHAHYETRPR